jgi:RNA polymerase sigma factor for flagellar operon FliA
MVFGRSARDELIKAHLHLVSSIAGTFRSRPIARGVELEDLIAYGREGLVDAASRFDSARGIPFGAFARHRIRGTILDGIRTQYWFGRRAHHHLRIDIAGEAAEPANDPRTGVRWNGRPMVTPPVDPDDTSKSLVTHLLLLLPARERRLLDLCYVEGKTLSQAAKKMGFGRAWASRLHLRALVTLRAALEDGDVASDRHRVRPGNDRRSASRPQECATDPLGAWRAGSPKP